MSHQTRLLSLLPLALLAAAARPAAAQTGTIAGKVQVTPPKYLAETVVYVVKAPGTFTPKTVGMDQWNAHLKAAPRNVTVAAGKTAEADFEVKR